MNAYDKDNFTMPGPDMEPVSDHFALTKPDTKVYISETKKQGFALISPRPLRLRPGGNIGVME